MDPITHYLTAKLTRRTLIKDDEKRLIAIFIISSLFPDIDYLIRLSSVTDYLKYHRGITHSFVGILLLSAFLSAIFYLFDKKEFTKKFAISYISMFIHIMMDWTNSYGTRLLLPFSDVRAALDAVFILDIYLWGFFAISLITLKIMKSGRRRTAIYFTAIMLLYFIIKFTLHQVAVEQIRTHPIAAESIKVSAFPHMTTPYKFNCVIETDESFLMSEYSLLDDYGEKFKTGTEYKKMKDNEYIRLVKETYLGEVFTVFSKYPYFSIEKEGDMTKVEIVDLRYKRGDKKATFTTTFLISKDMKVESAKFSH
ncbi:metal-dependent hydrolase [Thermodesulfobacteriota bacterium]